MRMSTIAPVVVRILLGAVFLISGSNKLLHFIDAPPLPPSAMALVTGMVATGYMIPLIAALEMIFGALLIVGRFVPLALTVFAPLIVNIALFHTLLAPAPPIVLFLLAAEIYLAWVYRDTFRAMLQAVPPHAATLEPGPEARLARARADS